MRVRTTLALIILTMSWSCSESTSPPGIESAEQAETVAVSAVEDPDAQPAAMAGACEEAAADIEQRQAERSLYDRIGGRDGIQAILVEMVDLHMANPEIKPLFDAVDMDRFFRNSTDFVSAGAGADVEYTGRDVTAVHERLNLTSSLFLAAGADLEQAMQNLGVAPDERQEMMCALVSLRGLVLPAESSDG